MNKQEMLEKGWKTSDYMRYLRRSHALCIKSNESSVLYEVKVGDHGLNCSHCNFNGGQSYFDNRSFGN